jgi:hypothetical protein
MPSRKVALAVCVMCLVAGVARAQPKVAPPPKPADDGPSLADTMKFIQDKLSDQAKINYLFYETNSTTGQTNVHRYAFELTNLSANPGLCNVTHHRKIIIDGNVVFEKDLVLSLKDIKNIVVMSWEQSYKRAEAAFGHPELSAKTDPPILVLQSQFPHDPPLEFNFYDEDLVNRVAKAMVHAVELCGCGSKPEPF